MLELVRPPPKEVLPVKAQAPDLALPERVARQLAREAARAQLILMAMALLRARAQAQASALGLMAEVPLVQVQVAEALHLKALGKLPGLALAQAPAGREVHLPLVVV